jgi:hypothetical protein
MMRKQENPLSTTRNVLLGVAALGALAAVVYAVNASAKPAVPTSGSAPAPLNPVGTNQNEV